MVRQNNMKEDYELKNIRQTALSLTDPGNVVFSILSETLDNLN